MVYNTQNRGASGRFLSSGNENTRNHRSGNWMLPSSGEMRTTHTLLGLLAVFKGLNRVGVSLPLPE
jgi:hypothetical protein